MTAPAPTPAEAAIIDRFGIFAEEWVIEEVARAMVGPDGDGPDLGGLGWDEIGAGTQNSYRRLATAAIATYRSAQDSREGYHVELGGQRFTQAQWEAMLAWRTGTDMPTEDAAIWSPPTQADA